MRIDFFQQDLSDIDSILQKEYILSNGRGGYCSSTVIDCHTRKYHGLLNLPLKHYNKTYNLLSRFEYSVIMSKREYHLTTNRFPGTYAPHGYNYIERIKVGYNPVVIYRVDNLRISQSTLMLQNEDTILIRFHIMDCPRTITLKATPFLAYRDVHSLCHENMFIRPHTFPIQDGFLIDPYEGLPAIYIDASKNNKFFPAPEWWKNFEYQREKERGYDYLEDLFSPGKFEATLKRDNIIIFRASINKSDEKIEQQWNAAQDRIQLLHKKNKNDPDNIRCLKIHAANYIVREKGHVGIKAGFHWFDEWGRDTMISLAGLTLCRGEHELALDILKQYTGYVQDGLLPNVISSKGNHLYNSIDTCLLYFWAVQEYIDFTGDIKSVEEYLLQALLSIITAFLDNRVPIAKLKADGLLYSGHKQSQYTWMDAQAHGKPVTPRNGAAVEINALFYNALCFLKNILKHKVPPDMQSEIKQTIKTFEANFERSFWNEETSCLFDVYGNNKQRDAAIRPNQLFALGLPYTCISREKADIALATVKQRLVTPCGLRTLSPQDARFIAQYRGSQDERDRAYHQGMVWPWLVGIYCDALLKSGMNKQEVREYMVNTFSSLWGNHLYNNGLFHISEIFTPLPPYRAVGCVAQAWSVAEILRVNEFINQK